MIRRFVVDKESNEVVELAGRIVARLSADTVHLDAKAAYAADDASERQGKRLREAALDRAERREWAHAKYGDERRWQE